MPALRVSPLSNRTLVNYLPWTTPPSPLLHLSRTTLGSSLSFVCKPPKSALLSMDEACPSSQISPSLSASYSSGDIQILSPMCSDLHLPRMPNTIYMKLEIEKNRTGVPKVFASKTLLRCDGQISAPSITAGTCLETGSLHPVNHGMHQEIG